MDFKITFNSIKNDKLIEAMSNIGVSEKTIKMVICTMDGTMASVRTVNIVLGYMSRKINKTINGTLCKQGAQIIAYADDILMIAKQRHIMIDILHMVRVKKKVWK